MHKRYILPHSIRLLQIIHKVFVARIDRVKKLQMQMKRKTVQNLTAKEERARSTLADTKLNDSGHNKPM